METEELDGRATLPVQVGEERNVRLCLGLLVLAVAVERLAREGLNDSLWSESDYDGAGLQARCHGTHLVRRVYLDAVRASVNEERSGVGDVLPIDVEELALLTCERGPLRPPRP